MQFDKGLHREAQLNDNSHEDEGTAYADRVQEEAEGFGLGRFIRRFNDMRFRNKMVLAYILFFILPFIAVGFFIVREYRQSALDKAIEQSEAAVERIKNRTAETLDVAIGLSSRLMLDSQMEEVATTRYRSRSDVVDAYRNYDTFRTYLEFNPEIAGIKLFVQNDTLLNNWEFLPIDAETTKSFWYRAAIDHSGLVGWYYYPSETRTAGNLLSLVRSVYFQENKSFGVLSIDVNTEYLNSVIRQEDFETLLTDEQGYVVASNRPGTLGKLLRDTGLGSAIEGKKPGVYQMAVDGRDSKVRIDKLQTDKSYMSLNVITIYPIDSIVREANRIDKAGIRIIAVFAALSIILIYSICTVMTNRLLKFSRQISKVSTGNFNVELRNEGKDEIGQITRQFNQMVNNVKELMDEVALSHRHAGELERKQNEIKLKMLASQINPHFLYNALESIRMKAHISGEQGISRTVKMLGKLLRRSLEITGQAITVSEEIEMVRAYLEIQKFRHEDRLNYGIDIEPEAGRISLPPLLIQPLVENAVVHGLERRPGGGTVAVSARIAEGALVVRVEDDGAGMSAEKLASVRRALREQEADRIGLRNVQMRLTLTYGEEAGLLVESEEHKGTRIEFRIPVEGSNACTK